MLQPCVQVGKVVIWMFLGLSPTLAGESFDDEHARLGGGTQGRSVRAGWVKSIESPWDQPWDSDRGLYCGIRIALKSRQKVLGQRKSVGNVKAQSEQSIMTVIIRKAASQQQTRVNHLLTCKC